MPNTYTWTATNLIGYPQYEGETDVITTVFYTVTADDGAGHTASLQNIQQTPLDPLVPFIPYPDLTNDIFIPLAAILTLEGVKVVLRKFAK